MTATLEVTHTYEARGALRDLFHDRYDELLVSGPVGTGKSRACLEKMQAVALKYPRFRGLVSRKVQDTLTKTVLPIYLEYVANELLEAGVVVHRVATARYPDRYVYPNGSEIWVGGMDKASKIMGSEFDMVYVSEATELRPVDWDNLTTRLRRGSAPYQQIISDCNPDKPTHWLKQRAGLGHTKILWSRPTDNPKYFNEDGTPTPEGVSYMAKLDRLTGVRRLRNRDGLWVAAEGIIWESFDQSKHVIPPFPIPAEWTRYWVVDFGHTHPFVLQCWAEDGDGRLFMYREIYMTKTLVEDHARKILGIVAPEGTWIEPKPTKIICDHDAEGRATLSKHLGMPNHKANKKVKLGLEAVEARFRADRIFFIEGALVEKDTELENPPYCTVDEIGGYVRQEGSEDPVKEEDDGCDCVRYMVADRDLRSKLMIPDDREVWF